MRSVVCYLGDGQQDDEVILFLPRKTMTLKGKGWADLIAKIRTALRDMDTQFIVNYVHEFKMSFAAAMSERLAVSGDHTISEI